MSAPATDRPDGTAADAAAAPAAVAASGEPDRAGTDAPDGWGRAAVDGWGRAAVDGWGRAAVDGLLIAAGLVLLAVTPKPPMMGDGLARYQALIQLLEQRQLPGMPYSLIGPLFATPLWAIGRWYGNTGIWLGQYNFLLFVLGLGALHLLLRDRMDPRLLRRFLLLLVCGSMIAAHVRDFYGETFTAVTVGVGLLAVALPDTSWATRAAGWTAVVLGVANTPASILALGLVAGVLCVRRRRLRYLSAVLAAVALVATESWWRYGDPLHSSYATHGGGKTVMPYSGIPGFSYPILLGLVAIGFSFGKGLLWFTPGLFLPVRRRLRQARPVREAGPAGADLWSVWLLWATFVAGLVLVYAHWWGWYGGLYWGPRFFLVAILPAALALAVCLDPGRAGPWTNLAALGAALLSVWGAADSLVYELWPWTCYENNYHLEALCHFTPEFSPLWYPFVDPPDLTALQRGCLVYYALAGLWLVAPLLKRLAGQVAAAAGGQRNLLAWRTWRW